MLQDASSKRAGLNVRGKDTVPVTSFEGAMGVLLYGMAVVVKEVVGRRRWVFYRDSVSALGEW